MTEPYDITHSNIKQSDMNNTDSDLVNNLDDNECAEFQALMPERIGAGEDLQSYSHMQTCDRCSALVRDLEYIAQAARQLIPVEEEPRDELWAQIQLAIERGDA